MLDHDVPSTYNQSTCNGNSQISISSEKIEENDAGNAFEGPEKLLEVWFAPAPNALPNGVKTGGLKIVNMEAWKEMLDLVNCKVLSVVESEHVDAYLLSESSMFVFPHKLILKTCGTTTLLLGLSRMLKIAAIDAGFPHCECRATTDAAAIPYRLFYSRKNFLFPDKQLGPHRCWDKEVEFLDGIFESGSAYMVGKMNGDHWYLYLTSPNASITPPYSAKNRLNNSQKRISLTSYDSISSKLEGHINNDETLEILMTDLDEENAKQFYFDHAIKAAVAQNSFRALKDSKNYVNNLKQSDDFKLTSGKHENPSCSSRHEETLNFYSQKSGNGILTPPEEACVEVSEGHVLGRVVSETCGLLEVYSISKYPCARVDSHLFSPCGFSANGVIPAIDGSSAHYFTVHVTPEPNCSYASFETNVPAQQTGRETVAVVEQVVNIFKPGHFSVTLFEAKTELIEDIDDTLTRKCRQAKMEKIKGYRRIDRIIHEFDGYDMVFRYFEREDWQDSPNL